MNWIDASVLYMCISRRSSTRLFHAFGCKVHVLGNKRERSYLSREYRGNSIPPCACSAKILGLGEGVLVLDLEGCPRVSGQESDSRKFPEIAHRHSEQEEGSLGRMRWNVKIFRWLFSTSTSNKQLQTSWLHDHHFHAIRLNIENSVALFEPFVLSQSLALPPLSLSHSLPLSLSLTLSLSHTLSLPLPARQRVGRKIWLRAKDYQRTIVPYYFWPIVDFRGRLWKLSNHSEKLRKNPPDQANISEHSGIATLNDRSNFTSRSDDRTSEGWKHATE